AADVRPPSAALEPQIFDLFADRDWLAFELGRLNRSAITLEIPDCDGKHMRVGNYGPRYDLLEQRPQTFSHRFYNAAHRAGDIERGDERRRVRVGLRLLAFPHAEHGRVKFRERRPAALVAVRLRRRRAGVV